MSTKVLIFDLDGTLVDTIEGLAVAMNNVLESCGLPQHEIERYKEFVGNGVRNLVSNALPAEQRSPERIDSCYEKMLDQYRKYYSQGLKLYPGIEELLDTLKEKNYILAMNSNKNQEMTEKIAESILSKWDFFKVIGAESDFARKPDPAAALYIAAEAGAQAAECIYIGDSEVDHLTAQNAGMKNILVSWGFRPKDDLISLQPEVLVDHPMEILKAL